MSEKEDQDAPILTLMILSTAQLFGLSLWFVTNSVIDQLSIDLLLNETDLSLLSITVTLGFVTGGLVSAITSISDRYPANKVFMVSSILGSTATASIVIFPILNYILLVRFLTGFFLAGIYPVGMKMAANHYKMQRGLAIGVLLSALTIGSGLPYIFLIVGTPSWQDVVLGVSTLAFLGGALVGLKIDEGPYSGKRPEFSIDAVKTIFSKNSVRLANLGYLGHMWELYAFWVWFPRMLKTSLENNNEFSEDRILLIFAIGSFAIFLGGGLANIIGGYISDRIGRTKFNIIMLSCSGLSSLVIGFFFTNPIGLLFVGIFWGITIIPDSPQYSTMITEVSDQKLVGSALAIQTASGFLLTIVSIWLIPPLVTLVSWRFAFMFLSVGPAVGIIAMLKLRNEPDSDLIANGLK